MYRVRTSISGPHGAPYLNTAYFNVVGGLTAANAVADLHTFWEAIKGQISNQLVLTTEAEVAEIDIATGDVTGLVATAGATTTGIQESEAVPFATQGLLRWRTGVFVGGREVRGRWFIPGVCEAVNSLGVPLASYRSTIDAAAAALIASSVSDLMIYSRKNRDAVPAITGTVWTDWAVLRSRRD